MTAIRCGLCAENLVFCGLCGRWFHRAGRSYKCEGTDAHLCGEPPPAEPVRLRGAKVPPPAEAGTERGWRWREWRRGRAPVRACG
jgi:hypothetical protein